jgi:TIR domain.
MKLLSEIVIHRKNDDATIHLLYGDLTAIPSEYAADILIISAYPKSYIPSRKTLMAALYNKGIFVGEMAKDKEVDLIGQLGCWLSKPLSEELQKVFNFKRILCFEPGIAALEDKTVVGNIFRCINTFVFDKQNNVIAMPVVASGNQKVPLGKMLPAILEAAIFWIENGLPLKSIKLVLYYYEQVEEALPIFNIIKHNYELNNSKKDEVDGYPYAVKSSEQHIDPEFLNAREIISMETDVLYPPLEERAGSPPHPDTDFVTSTTQTPEEEGKFDYFISYAHIHSDLISSFVQNMKLKNDKLRIFYDRDSIPPGGLWIKQISDTIQKASRVLVFLSPDYDNSPVCWDEFQCAKLMEYNKRTSIIQTIYLYNYRTEIPPIMGIYSYLDCREGDIEKLKACIPKIIR